MLKEIIRKEILDHLMSLRFAIACVLCFVVVLCSLFVRLKDYNLVLDDYSQNMDQVRHHLKENVNRPRRLIYWGVPLHQEPNPLKVFARGVEDRNGMSLHVWGHLPVQFFGQFLANTMVPLFPAMDVITFVGIIMSLLAIVFGYDAICGEKSRGTLRLMLSYSIPRDRVLLGKWLGGIITLTVPFLLTVICAVTIVLIQKNFSLSQTQWLKFAGVCGLALLYIAAIFSLALWVSCITPRPATSIMILVTIWLILVLAVPNLSPYLAQRLKPTDSPAQLETAKAAAAEEIMKAEIEDKLAKYHEEQGFKTKQWWREINWQDDEDWKRAQRRRIFETECRSVAWPRITSQCRKIDEDFERRLDEQIRLSRWISRVSPFSCFAMAAAELTDTGLLSKRHFLNEVRDYQEDLTEYGMAEWLQRARTQLAIRGTEEKLPDWPSDDNPIPLFKPRQASTTSDYLRATVLDAGILAGLTMLFGMLSFIGFLRYDVR